MKNNYQNRRHTPFKGDQKCDIMSMTIYHKWQIKAFFKREMLC